MKQRTLWKVAIAAMVVLVTTLGTARARQAWSESQERSRFDAAKAGALATLGRARSDGVSPQELAPFSHRYQLLASQQPPSSLPTLISGAATFYRRQAAAYRTLDKQTRSAVVRATLQTRDEAAAVIASFKSLIADAQSLDVDVSAAQAALGRAQRLFQEGSSPRQFRWAAGALHGSEVALRQATSERRAYVAKLVTRSNGSRDGVVLQASGETSSAQGQLSLLGLLTSRAGSYATQLTNLYHAVQVAPSATAAAVKEYRLHQEVASIAAVYSRTIPSKMIVISTERQWATMYQNGNPVFDTPVTTGGPELPTDHGVFHIYLKISPFVFHSPWGPDSPYYYPPTPVTFWMPFDGAEGLHDASWRSNFGPGSNLAPTDLGTGTYILGTHGCVNLPFAAAQYVWDWAPVGTTVVVD